MLRLCPDNIGEAVIGGKATLRRRRRKGWLKGYQLSLPTLESRRIYALGQLCPSDKQSLVNGLGTMVMEATLPQTRDL